jgi:hypothetical protein
MSKGTVRPSFWNCSRTKEEQKVDKKAVNIGADEGYRSMTIGEDRERSPRGAML